MFGQIYLGDQINSFEAELAGAEALSFGVLILTDSGLHLDCPAAGWVNSYYRCMRN